jgi:hypothetical protein
MKVLVACEYSGRVRDAFIRKGHDAISVDLLPTESEGPHYQGDIFEFLKKNPPELFDLLIAFPPCTHLSKAGGAHWKKKRESGEQQKAIGFVLDLYYLNIPKVAIENPVGALSRYFRKPDQIIHPYQFGDPWTKETCLWLKGLPVLKPTKIVEPKGNWVRPGNKRPQRKFGLQKEGAQNDPKLRALTFPGIANAMAEQYGE